MFSVKELLQATGGRLLMGKPAFKVRGVSIDSRTIRRGELFVALKGDRFDGHAFLAEVFKKGACGAIVDRRGGFDPKAARSVLIGVSDTLRAFQEIACFHRKRFSIPVVAITGSNGKTTTKEMAAAIVSRKMKVLKSEGNLNNHIGVPLTLLTLNRRHSIALIEMGINHRGELTRLCEIARPNMGLVTNIGPTHLEFLKNVEGVAKAKGELLEALDERSAAFLNADDPFTPRLRRLVRGSVVTFGIDEKTNEKPDIQAIDVIHRPGGSSFQLRLRRSTNMRSGARLKKVGIRRAPTGNMRAPAGNMRAPAGNMRAPAGNMDEEAADRVGVQLTVTGQHNVYNAAGAAAIATALNIHPIEIKAGLESFLPVRLRSQIIQWRGVRILNDSYNANPASMRSALETLNQIRGSGRAVAVLGDMLELGEESQAAHREIGRHAAKLGLDYLFTIGELAGFIGREAIRRGMPKDRVKVCGGLDEGAAMLKKIARNQDMILVKGSRGMKMEKIVEALMEE